MSMEVWLTYLGVIMLFMSTPGPSHLLMISVGMKNGFRRSLATAAGDLSANVVQMCLAALGLAAVLMSSRYGFVVLKWAGICYLLYMGVRQIRSSFQEKEQTAATKKTSLKKLWFKGFVTSAANPKAVVFFAALFPQFINHASPLPVQLFILGATYIVVDGLFLSFYGFSSGWFAMKMNQSRQTILDRFSGFGLIFCAVLLGFKVQENA